MDTKNLRSNASRGKRTDWRNQLPPDTRKKMFSNLMNTLRQQDHISGDEGLNKLSNTDIVQFEEKIYTVASSQRDYLKRITSEMIAIEKKSLSSKKITTDVPKNQVQRYHPLHDHPLIRFNITAHDPEEKKYCYACGEVLDGLYFGCEDEDCREFLGWSLHEWCLEKPSEISHPRHPQHHLTLYESRKVRRTICDECLCDPEEGFYYCCLHCGFMLHFQCAFLTINEPQRSQHRNESFRHVAHMHELILYNQVRDIYQSPRFVRKGSETTKQNILIYCQWCTKAVLSGRTYACIGCELYFHQACAFIVVPFKIRHHSHNKGAHILDLRIDQERYHKGTTCRACKKEGGICYLCQDCKWWIHGKCSTLLPSLKSEYHDHDLIYFENSADDYKGMDFSCHTCSGGIDDIQKSDFNGSYRCIECDVNFHLSCILPDTVKHKYHWHSLTLMNSSKKDDSDDQHYCDICETERNPNHSVYACKECDYCVAHIECALNQERKNELQLLQKGPSVVLRYMEVRPDSYIITTAVKKWTDGDYVEMRHPFHDHFLSGDQTPYIYSRCNGCDKDLTGMSFSCKNCGRFSLHERCAEFPLELLNFPLHSHHPPLVLKYHDYSWFSTPSFICNVCGKVTDGDCFRYQCLHCSFFVDIKCAFLSTHTLSNQQKNIVAKHFSHQHQLHLVPCGAKDAARCRYCGSKIEGLGYRCMETTCWFHLHKSCLRQIPRQLKQLHFHPSHSLVLSRNPKLRCNVCGLRLHCLGYDCSACGADISVHSVCALFQRRTLKSSHHDHVLYYFGRDINLLIKHLIDFDYYYSDVWFKCERCGGSCSRAFYRCLECDINFHLECIPIPPVVKSKCHRHHVKLVDSFVVEGYDLDDQYCDVCEEKRDSRDHAYFCDRCSDPFVGHVDCVLYKMVQIIEEAKRGPSNHCCNDLDSTDDERVFGNQRFMVRIEKEISFSSEKENDYGTEFVDFHPTKPWLVTSDKVNLVYIWSYETEELQLEKSFKAKYSVSKFIERENWIVIGDARGYIYVYNYETSKKIDKFRAHDFRVDCLAVHSSRSYLLSSGDRFVIRLWDWKKKKGTWLCIKEFVDHWPTRGYNLYARVAFNPKDLNTFASIAADGNLMIWNINSSDSVRVIRVHPKDEKKKKDLTFIRSIEFFMHVDKQYLLASFDSGLIKIWEYTQEDYGHHQDLTPKLPIQISWSGDDGTVDICIDAINYRCKLEKEMDFGLGDYFNYFAWGKSSNRMVLLCENAALMLKFTSPDDGGIQHTQQHNVK